MEKLFYSLDEVQEITGLSRSFIYKQIRLGHLPVSKAGARTLVHTDDLVAWTKTLKKFAVQ